MQKHLRQWQLKASDTRKEIRTLRFSCYSRCISMSYSRKGRAPMVAIIWIVYIKRGWKINHSGTGVSNVNICNQIILKIALEVNEMMNAYLVDKINKYCIWCFNYAWTNVWFILYLIYIKINNLNNRQSESGILWTV